MWPGSLGVLGYDRREPDTLIFVGYPRVPIYRNKQSWDSYQWNPPQYLVAGTVADWDNWSTLSGPDYVSVEPSPEKNQHTDLWTMQFAYQVGDDSIRPDVPQSPKPKQEHGSGILTTGLYIDVPDGWTEDWPGTACWMIKRWVMRVPPSLGISTDPAAMEKPSWDEMVDTLKLLNIQDEYYDVRRSHDHVITADETKRQITDRSLLAALSGQIYVGGGLDHMTGLLQMVEQATEAGARMPPVELRDEQHRPKMVYRQSQVRELLAKVAERENVVESAHNRIIRQIIDKWNAAEDETRTWSDRLDDMNDYADLVENYEVLLKAEMAKYDPDALPDDLDELKAVLIERLEAAAMARTKYLKKAATQQGIDRGASCADEDRAVQAVAREAVLGTMQIKRADDDIWRRAAGTWAKVTAPDDLPVDTSSIQHSGDQAPADALGADGEWYLQLTGAGRATAAYTAAQAKIGAVVAANTPTWRIAATEHPANPAADIELTASHVDVIARQPAGVDGDVAATVTADKPISLTRYTPGDVSLATSEVMRISASSAVAAGDVVTIELKAENLCGPSSVTVKLTIPGSNP